MITHQASNKILDKVFGGTDFTEPTDWYIGLLGVMPAADGSGFVEVSGGNYSRLNVTNVPNNFPAASAGAKENNYDLTWPTPSDNWGLVVGVGMFDDAVGGGQMWFAAALKHSFIVSSGTAPTISKGDLVFVVA